MLAASTQWSRARCDSLQ